MKSGQTQLWVRSLASLEAQPLPGTEGAQVSFWSADSRMLGFFVANQLKTIDASGGPVQTLCDAAGTSLVRDGAWNRDGVILFSPSATSSLWRVSANGGEATQLTTLDSSRKEGSHRHPSFLPDGRHYVYLNWPSNSIWLGSIDSKEATPLFPADSRAIYVAPGFLLFIRQNTLVARPFDAAALKVTGEAVPIAEHVRLTLANSSLGAFSASQNGVVAYRSGASATPTQLAWVDRAGRPVGPIGQVGLYRNPVLSPDGTNLAFEVATGRTSDIWLMELGRAVASRLTFDPANEIYPVWSPDGTRIAFASDRQGGAFNVYQKSSNGLGGDELLLKAEAESAPYDWSRDGRFIVFRHVAGVFSLGIVPLAGDRKPRVFEPSRSGSAVVQGQVSPDGRWLAYSSNESGRYETYVQSFPTPGGKWQISKDGGVHPRWRGDSKELFFWAADGRLMAVPIRGETALEAGAAMPLFLARMLGGPTTSLGLSQQYDVASGGQRFLLNVPTEEAAPSPIVVVLNWTALIKK